MKPKIIALIIVLIIIVSGCLVKSIHPFYKESDIIFDTALIGLWSDKDSSIWTIEQFQVSGFFGDTKNRNSYIISFNEKDEAQEKFIVNLFRLNNQLYVDFMPKDIDVPDITSFHLVKAHSIAKIDIAADSINLKWFNESWLAGLFENNKIRIAHETIIDEKGEESYVLTASTDELQKFIIKYGNDPNAFKDNFDKGKTNNEKEEILCFLLKRIK
jgi:hypothetical protein